MLNEPHLDEGFKAEQSEVFARIALAVPVPEFVNFNHSKAGELKVSNEAQG